MYRIVVTEVTNIKDDEQEGIERYRQTVDALDIPALIAVINKVPRKKREPKAAK
jgi:hypothetical protein